jgi:hypothetical protein
VSATTSGFGAEFVSFTGELLSVMTHVEEGARNSYAPAPSRRKQALGQRDRPSLERVQDTCVMVMSSRERSLGQMERGTGLAALTEGSRPRLCEGNPRLGNRWH